MLSIFWSSATKFVWVRVRVFNEPLENPVSKGFGALVDFPTDENWMAPLFYRFFLLLVFVNHSEKNGHVCLLDISTVS